MAIETVTITSSGEVNIKIDDDALMTTVTETLLPSEYAAKITAIYNAMQSAGQSEIHSERRQFKSFEHVVQADEVTENPLGTTISLTDFDYLITNRVAARSAIENPPEE